MSVNSRLKATKIVHQWKAFYRQRIPESSCARSDFLSILFFFFCGQEPTFAFFRMSGDFFSFDAVSNNSIGGKAIGSTQICIIFMEILPQPFVVSASKVFMISDISFWLTWKELVLTSVLYPNCGSVFPLLISIHIDAKK